MVRDDSALESIKESWIGLSLSGSSDLEVVKKKLRRFRSGWYDSSTGRWSHVFLDSFYRWIKRSLDYREKSRSGNASSKIFTFVEDRLSSQGEHDFCDVECYYVDRNSAKSKRVFEIQKHLIRKAHYTMVWWAEFYVKGPSEVGMRFYHTHIRKYTFWKLHMGMELSGVERGLLNCLPIPVGANDCVYLRRVDGPFGTSPPTVSCTLVDSFILWTNLPQAVRSVTSSPEQMFRVEANPNTAYPAFARNAQKSRAKMRDSTVLDRLDWCCRMFDIKFPTFYDLDMHKLVNSSEINESKQAGAVGTISSFRNKPKSEFVSYALLAAHRLVGQFEAGLRVVDTSLFQSGGRTKRNFNKKEGDIIASRPVWMASMVSELLCDFWVSEFINYCKDQDVDYPLYIGKTLGKTKYQEFARMVGGPDRVCTHGDYSKWDSTVPRCLNNAVFCILRSLFPSGKKWDSYFYFLFTGLTFHPVVVPGGHVYAFKRGGPSGHKLTSIFNTLANLCIFACNAYEVCMGSITMNKTMGGKSPMKFMFLGDDFAIVSTSPEFDGDVRSLGEKYSQLSRDFFDMDLDTPYVGPFALDNPDMGGFEFLRVRFTRDMKPTIASQELLHRVMLPERRSKSVKPKALSSAIGYGPQHSEGVDTWLLINQWLYCCEYGYEATHYVSDFRKEELWRIYSDDVEREWLSPKKGWWDQDSDKILILTSTALKGQLLMSPRKWAFSYENFVLSTFGFSGTSLMSTRACHNKHRLKTFLEKGAYLPIRDYG